MSTNGRTQTGQFAKGNPGGPGRPPVAREQKYVETMQSVCSVDDWQAICARAVKDAKAGDYRAREWLSKYLLGEPQRQVLHGHVHANLDAESGEFANASTDDIIAARVAVAKLRRSSQNGRAVV